MEAFLDRFVGNISPAALLASTFFWSWMDLVPFSPLLFTAAGAPAERAVLAVSLLVAALLMGVMACVRPMRERMLAPSVLALVALSCGSGGTVLVFLGALLGLPALTCAGAVLTGCFQGAGVVAVGCLAVCQGKTNALIHLAACLPANIVFVLLGMFLQPGASVVLCALLPLLCVLSYRVYLARGNNARIIAATAQPSRHVVSQACSDARKAAARPGYAVLLLVVTVAFGLVNADMQFSGDATFGALSNYASLFVRAAMAVWVFCSYVFRARQPFELLVAAVAIMAAGLFVLWLAPGAALAGLVGGTVFCAGYAMFDMLLWALIVLAHRGMRMTLQRFVCVVYALDQLGNFLGTALGMAGLPAGAVSLALGVLGVAMLVLAFVLLSSRGTTLGDLHMAVMEPEGAQVADARHRAADSPRAAPEAAAGQVDVRATAARYFLTEREADVLELLFAGRSVPYISEQLTVSPNTVKTHVRHIYAKLDVHNRQELLDVLSEPGLA